MEDEYGIGDLRQYYSHQPVSSSYPYDMLMFRTDSVNNLHLGTSSNVSSAVGCGGGGGFQMGGGGGDGGTARWPRQETLSLLEIRSRLDSKFKEANQKGPLWDEVSRIMCEEYGYQRSGKKCREKFENLYKYYKKTKDGKGGRQDGKHYRFFRQLEALYGDHPSNSETFPYSNNNNFPTNNNQELYNGTTTTKLVSDISVPNSSDYDTVSSDCSVEDARNKKRKGLKAKIKESIDEQMTKLMEKQETWMQKMMGIIEKKEAERVLREEQWRRQDAARIDREHKVWASERAWIQGRDVAIMEAFHKLANKPAAETESAVSNYLLKCSNKRKEDSTDSIIGVNDQRVQINDCHDPIRYFVGDSYGRL